MLRSQPDDVRAFLLDTSVLSELTGSLCDAVTGRSDGQTMLKELERSNLFLVPLDDQRQWFRYHHLFADALRAQLNASDPERLMHLHQAAAHWYTGQGRLTGAIAHALAAPDPEHAADLLELALAELRRRRENRALRDWLVSLPEDVVRRRPLLAACVGWTRLTWATWTRWKSGSTPLRPGSPPRRPRPSPQRPRWPRRSQAGTVRSTPFQP